VVLGDITVQGVDAIVTAANEPLLGGGGMDGAIHHAAGPRLAAAGAAIGPCDPGNTMVTPAFGLDPPVRHVIHTDGPVWEGGGCGEAAILASCYRRSLEIAGQLGAAPSRSPPSPPASTATRPTRPPASLSPPSDPPRPASGRSCWSPTTSRHATS